MRKVAFFLTCSALMACSLPLWAQDPKVDSELKSALEPGLRGPADSGASAPAPGQLNSPLLAQKLHDTAYELANSEGAGAAEIAQAIALLKAAMALDSGAGYVRPTLIELACRDSRNDHSELVRGLLLEYVDQSADLEVVRKAVVYLLERHNSREEREKALEELLMTVGNKNAVVGSELITYLGMLMAEKPDLPGAGFYLSQAYKGNKYNRKAFEKLAELFPDKLGPEYYLEHFRLVLRKDPSSIDAALALGRYAERLELYDIAANAYQYAADLFNYVYPSEPLPAAIYIPWAMSSYNTKSGQAKCMEIADVVRRGGRFSLPLEALAGKAAAKLGDGERATQILQAAEEKARQILMAGGGANGSGAAVDGGPQEVTAKHFAWFYCFVLPNPQNALDWANKAYAMEPNTPSAASILAYALMMNKQPEQYAKALIEKNEPSQISELVLAQIQIAQGDKGSAKDTLISAIARDPGSLEAERARVVLTEQGGEYIPPVDPDVLLNMLAQAFGKAFVPAFTPPEQILSIQFNMRGNKFPYGSEFGASIAIINNSSEPLIVSDDGLFRGNIRVDADVSGDLAIKIPQLVSREVRSRYLISPGESILIPVKLFTGKLRRILQTYPQASLDIEFTLYIDPVVAATGQVANRLAKIEPIKLLVKRPGIELTSKYLRNRFNLLSEGQESQKIKTAELFIGLLMEEYALSNRKPPYQLMYADWMPTMFNNALVHESGLLRNPDDGQWVVKVHTMADMLYLPMDREVAAAVAENLNNSNWPVRMMAIYLLARTQKGKFDKVLEWSATYDPDKYVRAMAVALGAAGSKSQGSENPSPPAEPVKPPPVKEK